jgi:hypothetical protein
VTNSIVWNGGDEIYEGDSDITVTNSCVTGGFTGTDNTGADPLFYRPALQDWHLQPNSPCINAGNDVAVSQVNTDLDGGPRISKFVGLYDASEVAVDMGCYEWPREEFFGMSTWSSLSPDVRSFPGFPEEHVTKALEYPEHIDNSIQLKKDAGVKMVRVYFSWSSFQPIHPDTDGENGGWLWTDQGDINPMLDLEEGDWDVSATSFDPVLCPDCPPPIAVWLDTSQRGIWVT